MSIQQKILQFRKYNQMSGKRVDTLVYRASKDEAIEVAEFLSKSCRDILADHSDPEFCIQKAKQGIFKPLHDLILDMNTLFGVEIHPDWQEYTNKNMYY